MRNTILEWWQRGAVRDAGAALQAAGLLPGRAEWRRFLDQLLLWSGAVALAAAVVFFVAHNWSHLGKLARFSLVEVLVVAAVVGYWRLGSERAAGKAALLAASIVLGALLALFGQTYQTGADVYELFLSWALLALPLAAAAQWSLATAAWICVLDLSLCLFCGWNPRGGFLWMLFDGERFTTSHALLLASVLNIGLWALFEHFDWRAAPPWVRRLILFFGLCFATWLGFAGAYAGDRWSAAGEDWVAIVGSALVIAAVATAAFVRRRDVYPLALAAGSAVFVVTCWIGRAMQDTHEAVLFVIALWLIMASTLGGRGLLQLAREWDGRA